MGGTPLFGLVNKYPIKTREISGIYGEDQTIKLLGTRQDQ
jgi:hypothetical protein